MSSYHSTFPWCKLQSISPSYPTGLLLLGDKQYHIRQLAPVIRPRIVLALMDNLSTIIIFLFLSSYDSCGGCTAGPAQTPTAL
jgi:hypothetical protein